MATLLGNFESGSTEWHDARAKGIGGSEVSVILGFNKWKSPYTLWAEKTGRLTVGEFQSEAMEWGTRLESVILDKFTDEHPDLWIARDAGTWCHDERPWQIANPDALYETEDGRRGVIEVKTALYADDWKNGDGEPCVPAYYNTQVQWYLNVLGLDHAYVVVLFHGNEYREFEVQADAFAQSVAVEEVERFLKYVEEDVAPDFDGALSTYDTVRKMHPEITDDVVELGYLGEQYLTAERHYEEAQAALNEVKSRVLDAMGTAKRGHVNDVWAFTRQSRGGGTPFLTKKRG